MLRQLTDVIIEKGARDRLALAESGKSQSKVTIQYMAQELEKRYARRAAIQTVPALTGNDGLGSFDAFIGHLQQLTNIDYLVAASHQEFVGMFPNYFSIKFFNKTVPCELSLPNSCGYFIDMQTSVVQQIPSERKV